MARRWPHVRPPLRPTPEDAAFYRAAIDHWSRDHGPPRAVILGVTPELCDLPWPTGADLIAVDGTREMISLVWPGPPERAILAEWTDMPLPDASRDIVVCDGGFDLVPYPQGSAALVREMARVVAPGGLCILRLFTPPKARESAEEVLRDLAAGRVPDVTTLKLRLWMALQENTAKGVRPRAVWDAICSVDPDLWSLARRNGWPVPDVQGIEQYRDSQATYHFPTADEVRTLMCRDPGGFDVLSAHEPTYARGDQFPTIVFTRSARRG